MTYFLFALFVSLFGWWLIFFEKPKREAIKFFYKLKNWVFSNNLKIKIYLAGFLTTILIFLFSKVLVLSIISLIFTVALPGIVYQRHKKKILDEKANAWPYLVEDLASAIRAGMPLSDSLIDVSKNAPEPLKPELSFFSASFRKTSQMNASLLTLKEKVTDPIGVMVVRMLLVVSRTGANDLAKALKILNEAIREHEQVAREVRARQSWVINSARLAVIAPWVVLIAIWPQPTVQTSYQSQQGQFILLLVAAVCFIAYILMKKMAIN